MPHEERMDAVIVALGCQGWVRSATGLIRALAGKAIAFEKPVNRPDVRHRLGAQLLELPLNGKRPPLSIARLCQSLLDPTNQPLQLCWGLRRESLRGPRVVLSPARIRGIIAFEPRVQPGLRIAQDSTKKVEASFHDGAREEPARVAAPGGLVPL
jgi:hypothetical protein